MALFALTALPLFLLQPSAVATLTMAAALSLSMIAVAYLSVMDGKTFETAHLAVKLLAPVQFALMIWLAVYAGHELSDTSFALSCLAALGALAAIIAADALASAMLLLVADRGKGVTGVSLVSLISAKYAGLLGRII
jgi:formate/nitrite transporter FocA (FNT family)